VFVIDSDVAKRREVKLGLQAEGYVEVKGGIAEGSVYWAKK
jgi:multidrug efflux pump subunit AcrA (membrane-fusion protein)